ncbi:MAG: hypothetical protein R2818_03995 [Flavobacteriales bacterium]
MMQYPGYRHAKPIGDIKTGIKDAILDGATIQNDRAQAWELMKAEGTKLELTLQPGFDTPPAEVS